MSPITTSNKISALLTLNGRSTEARPLDMITFLKTANPTSILPRQGIARQLLFAGPRAILLSLESTHRADVWAAVRAGFRQEQP
jgi:hypothetical protein